MNKENTNELSIQVPYIVHESELARSERQIKRLWTALIVSIAIIFATNCIWIWYISQYDFESYEISTGDGGYANYIGNDGDIYNGESSSEKTSEEER